MGPSFPQPSESFASRAALRVIARTLDVLAVRAPTGPARFRKPAPTAARPDSGNVAKETNPYSVGPDDQGLGGLLGPVDHDGGHQPDSC